MSKVRFYIDEARIEKDREEKGMYIEAVPPIIKSGGEYYGDAGIDLFAAHDFDVPAHTMYVANSYVGILIDPGLAGFLFPRGGDNFLLGAGVIDTGYIGTIRSKIINPFDYTMRFKQGDSIGQIVLFRKAYVETPNLIEIRKAEVDIISERGADGRITHQFNL